MNRDISFLKRLLDAPGPSGFEVRAARAWRAEAEAFADDVRVDVNGNSYATINRGGAPSVMLAGHIDEIGLSHTWTRRASCTSRRSAAGTHRSWWASA
jgi:endoglucanase